LEHYDDDPIPVEDDEMGEDGDTMGMFGNIKSLVYHGKDEEDPYITLPANEEEDEDREELQILGTDNMVLAARIEDEVAHLEVYVYEDAEDNLYVHHDVMLPAIPLAVEWIDFPVHKKDAPEGGRGNFVAIGTMDPDIEIWDLDIVDCMYPNAILGQGGQPETEKPKKKKKKSKKARDDYHVDAVLSLAANRQHRNLLASASADQTVKLWDLNTTQCAKSYSYHTDKVCSIAWHPVEATALLSGSYDRTIIAADLRAPDKGQRKWTVESDVENVKWDPHDSNYFYVSSLLSRSHVFARLTYCHRSQQNLVSFTTLTLAYSPLLPQNQPQSGAFKLTTSLFPPLMPIQLSQVFSSLALPTNKSRSGMLSQIADPAWLCHATWMLVAYSRRRLRQMLKWASGWLWPEVEVTYRSGILVRTRLSERHSQQGLPQRRWDRWKRMCRRSW